MEEESQGIHLDNPWSQLVSTAVEESDDGEVVPIIGNKLSIGRKRALVDLVIPGNLHVSGCHCVLTRHLGSKVTLKDTSSNGTLLNGKRVEKNMEVEVAHNDVITIVNRKDNPRLNIAYRFENLQEVDSTLTYDLDTAVEATKEGTEEETMDVTDGEVKEEVDVGQKRKVQEEASQDGVPSTKVSKTSPSFSSKLMDTDVGEDKPVEPSEPSKPAMAKQDSIAETLVCQICQDILHDCVSLQPCLHSYCAGCYSDWMAESNLCPACRKKVKRISKNHIVNNLVDAYLRANPDKARSAEDLQELDNKNRITHDMLYPKKERSGYDSADTAEDDSDDSSDHATSFTTPSYFGALSSLLPLSSSLHSATPLSLCRQCPHHPDRALSASLPYPHTCSVGTAHVLCRCCLRPMPNRADSSIPQSCELCRNHFCALYWTCPSSGCSGCLAKFKEFNFQPACLSGIVGNAYESTILKNYLQSKGMSVQDLLEACCAKLGSGDYTCVDSRVSPDTIICGSCGLRSLKELCYQYRRDIPSDQLPPEVAQRVDCYWGKECRTQYNKPEHAKKFNHVCERTRQS